MNNENLRGPGQSPSLSDSRDGAGSTCIKYVGRDLSGEECSKKKKSRKPSYNILFTGFVFCSVEIHKNMRTIRLKNIPSCAIKYTLKVSKVYNFVRIFIKS